MPGLKRKSSNPQGGRRLRRTYSIPRRLALVRRVPLGLHRFKRTFQSSEIIITNISPIGGALSFSLSSLPSSVEFTALFDQYRIDRIRVELVPLNTSSDLNPSATAYTVPNMHTILDYDDATTPANLDELLQYPNRKMTRGLSKHVRSFKPHVAVQVYKTAITSGYGSKAGQWLDCIDATVPHYGIKWHTDGNYTGILVYKVYVTMTFSCKGVR